MRVPLSWLHEFCDPGLPAEDLAEVLTLGGLEVEAVDRPSAGARGVVVVEVRAIAPIEGSDKLRLAEAFDGDRTWEIVCGAANVAAGDRVPAALPGATLPGGAQIGRKQLFGVTSHGMLASARELGVGEDHTGIWILDPDAPVGADLNEWLELDDAVLDIDVTPDRGYALSLHGIARDVAALTGAELRLPDLPGNPGGDPGVPVTIEDPADCARFDVRAISGVRGGRTPARLQRRLAAVGMRSVSPAVDATNLAMLETGHPIHPYDRARLRGPELRVRRARAGERLVTLDGTDRVLDPDDLVIADAGGVIGLAGIMGGEGTEIGPDTTDLVVEVAAFDRVAVLRTGRRHRLHTEARTRFERIVPPESVGYAASRVAQLITELAGGAVAGGTDHYPAPPPERRIRLRPARARSRLGVALEASAQAALLEAVGCSVGGDGGAPGALGSTGAAGGELSVRPPAYRPDLVIEEDLYEEIARIHGYDDIPRRVPSTGRPGRRSPQDVARRAIRRALAGAGWTEAVLFPFISDQDLIDLGLPEADSRRQTIKLVNPLSKEESVLRTTLLPGLLATVRRNVNRQTTDIAIFETGRAFVPPTDADPAAEGGPTGVTLPFEPVLLGLAGCGDFTPARHDRPGRPIDFADVMGAVDIVRAAVGAGRLSAERTEEAPYHPGRAARVAFDGVDVGVVGELHPRVIAAYDVPPRTVAGELRLDRIVADGVAVPVARMPSPLPGLRFDVAILVQESVPHAAVEQVIRDAVGPRLSSLTLFDVYAGDAVPEGQKSLAFSLVLDDPDTQLTDAEEAAAIDAIAAAAERELGGHLRR